MLLAVGSAGCWPRLRASVRMAALHFWCQVHSREEGKAASCRSGYFVTRLLVGRWHADMHVFLRIEILEHTGSFFHRISLDFFFFFN